MTAYKTAFYNRSMPQIFDVCIRGAGVVGHTLALLLARERLRVALVEDPVPQRVDIRAYALNAASRQLLQSLRSWPDPVHATAITQMQVRGDQDGEVVFDATDQGVDALAWIVDVPALEARLAEAVRYQPQVERVSAPVPATLTAICEGRASPTRTEWGVQFDVQPYAQHAIATRLLCELPHGQRAWQWFSEGSILAFLPLNGPEGRSVAAVWSVPTEQVPGLLALDDESFAQHLQAASGGALGELRSSSARTAWPLQLAQARQWCGPVAAPDGTGAQTSAQSWVLAGDAAHNVHPLAGQGLNLGLGDVEGLARVLGAREDWRSLADVRLLRRYERQRKAEIFPLGLATDGLQQLFSRTEPPLQLLRNWGMNHFERSGVLKNWMAHRAMDSH